MNIFSFFSGAGFLDLGFELQGHYNIVFVNEFHEAFNRIYRYARQNIGIAEPRYGHHVEDITEYVDGTHEDKMQRLLGWVEESKEEELTGFIGGPHVLIFQLPVKIEDVTVKMANCLKHTQD